MTFQYQVSRGILAHLFSQTLQVRVGSLTHFRLVQTELNVQGFLNVFLQVLLTAFLVYQCAGRSIRAFVGTVDYAVTIVVQFAAGCVNLGASRGVGTLIAIIRYAVTVAVGYHVFNYRCRLFFLLGCTDQEVQACIDFSIPALGAEAVVGTSAHVQQEVRVQQGLETGFQGTDGFLEIVGAVAGRLGAELTGTDTHVGFERGVAGEVFTQATVSDVDVCITNQVSVGVVTLPPTLDRPVTVEAVAQLGTGKGYTVLAGVLVVVIADVDPVLTDVTTKVEITLGNFISSDRSGRSDRCASNTSRQKMFSVHKLLPCFVQ